MIGYYLQLFFLAFGLLLVFAYLLPAGFTYWFFYIWKKDRWAGRHIQGDRYPDRRTLRRDIRWSLLTVVVFALLTVLTVELIRSGNTKVYTDIDAHGWLYLLASPFLFLLLHDTYFYWSHRFMHWRPVYRYVHRLHHRTVTPSPWTMLAFQPPEAVIQYGILFVAIFLLPFHPAVLILASAYNVFVNCGGHSGFEFSPAPKSPHSLLNLNNTVTHHDLHHAHFHCNFSMYFNMWDRLMGTYKTQALTPSGTRHRTAPPRSGAGASPPARTTTSR